MSRLDEIGVRCNTDKASLGRVKQVPGKPAPARGVGHDYLRKYEFYLARYCDQPDVAMLELGAGPEWNIGASARLWQEFFPRDDFRLHVADLKPMAMSLANDRVAVTVGDLGDPMVLRRLASSSYDVVLDDASHIWHHQLLAFEHLFPAVRRGGLFVIEDIETSFGPERECWAAGSTIDTFAVLARLVAKVAGRGRSHPPLAAATEEEHPVLAFWPEIESITLVNDACIIAKTGYYRAIGLDESR